MAVRCSSTIVSAVALSLSASRLDAGRPDADTSACLSILTGIYHTPIFIPMKMLTIRISDELHKAFKLKCVSEDTDMVTVVNKLIEDYVKEKKPKKQK
jgi:hypothetical protein